MRRRFLLLDVLLPGLALAAVLAGFHLSVPAWMSGGVLILGLRFLAAGGLSLRDRRIPVWNPNYRRFDEAIREYRGAAAVPKGLAGLLGGGVLAVLALAHLSGVPLAAMRQAVLARPALALVPVGGVLLLYGLGFLMGFRDDGDTLIGPPAWNTLITLPGRLGGLVLCLLGLVCLGACAWGLIYPDTLPGLAGQQPATLDQRRLT